MVDKDLAVRETIELTPGEVVVGATKQAKLLMDIVDKTKCFQEISGKKYLQVEAWETIGAFNRTHAETESISPITKKGIVGEDTPFEMVDIIGYQARVQLWKDGVVVGGAIMPCFFTENCCRGKEGDAKHKACMSAAQTFATSKAYRMNFSYVAILAGYQPLPAEEITEDMRQDKTQHWCSIHDTEFFKRGKMKWYAHKIGDTDKWCSEEQAKKAAAPAKPAETAAEQVTKAAEQPAEAGEQVDETVSKREDLFQWIADKMNWPNSDPVRTWLINACKIEPERIDAEPEAVYREVCQLQGWPDIARTSKK